MAAPTIQQKDTTFTKIFVGGLPYHTTDQSLREFFEQCGDIEEAVVITDRQTGKSRGYGFVTMSDRAAAERACKDPNPIIDGRKANVNLAYLGAKPRIPAAFPGFLKAGLPGVAAVPGQFGLPQYIYPSANCIPGLTAQSLALPTVSPSPLSPTSATTFPFDYATAAAMGYPTTASQLTGSGAAAAAAAYEGYPYTTAAGSAYIANPQAFYTAVAQPPALGHFATTSHFQQQQIAGERLQ